MPESQTPFFTEWFKGYLHFSVNHITPPAVRDEHFFNVISRLLLFLGGGLDHCPQFSPTNLPSCFTIRQVSGVISYLCSSRSSFFCSLNVMVHVSSTLWFFISPGKSGEKKCATLNDAWGSFRVWPNVKVVGPANAAIEKNYYTPLHFPISPVGLVPRFSEINRVYVKKHTWVWPHVLSKDRIPLYYSPIIMIMY